MAKKRKRAPGGGRKPSPNKKVMFSTRLEPSVMAALKVGADTFPGKSVSAFAEFLIDKGLREREENARDPSVSAICFLISELAEYIRWPKPDGWHSNPFLFRAFKIAVARLLDALEPRGEMQAPPIDERIEQYAKKAKGGPFEWVAIEKAAEIRDTWKSPQSAGAKAAEYTLYELYKTVPDLDKDLWVSFLNHPKAAKGSKEIAQTELMEFERRWHGMPRVRRNLYLTKPEGAEAKAKDKADD